MEYHRASFVAALFNGPPPAVLFLLRHPEDDIEPNKWTMVSEHIEPGETDIVTAVRGLREEAGIVAEKGNLVPFGTVVGLAYKKDRTQITVEGHSFGYVLPGYYTPDHIALNPREHVEKRLVGLPKLRDVKLRGDPDYTTIDQTVIKAFLNDIERLAAAQTRHIARASRRPS
jgi:8-oxo-dGTP pyrophosphatase MutT (NUDIX family)